MRYEVTTALTPREALEQAAAYFGPGGMGLHVVSQTPHSLVLGWRGPCGAHRATRCHDDAGIGDPGVGHGSPNVHGAG